MTVKKITEGHSNW